MVSDPRGAGGLLVLGFDTSAAHCAAALVSGTGSGGRLLAHIVEPMARGQAERLLPMLEAALAHAGVGWDAVNGIAVCTGPGNFTGLRLSVAAARGLALALGKPAVGVTRFEALAEGCPGPVFVTIEAPRDQAFAQVLNDGVTEGSPRLAPLADLVAPAGAHCVGYQAGEIAARAGGTAGPETTMADPAAVARIAAGRIAAGQPEGGRPAPLYLRPPDAAPMREAPPPMLD